MTFTFDGDCVILGARDNVSVEQTGAHLVAASRSAPYYNHAVIHSTVGPTWNGQPNMLSRLPQVLAHNPSHHIIMPGEAAIWRPAGPGQQHAESPEEFEAHLRELIETTKLHGTKIVLLTPPIQVYANYDDLTPSQQYYADDVGEYCAIIRKLASIYNCDFIDVHDKMATDALYVGTTEALTWFDPSPSTHNHYSALGNAKWAAYFDLPENMHVARVNTSGPQWHVAAAVDISGSDSPNWVGHTIRQVIPRASLIVPDGSTQVKVTFEGGYSNHFTLTEAFIGVSGSGVAFASNPTKLTFGGLNGAVVPSSHGRVTSDPAAFTIPATGSIIVSLYCGSQPDRLARRTASFNGWQSYYKLANDAANVSATGYSQSGSKVDGVAKIEVHA